MKKKTDHLDPWLFLRSFTFKDALTSFSIALLYLATFELIDYLSDWQSGFIIHVVKIVAAIFFLMLNHIVYKLEHGHSNNFMGRSMHGCVLVVLYFIFRNLDAHLTGFDMPNRDSNLVGFIFAVIIFVLLIEFVLTVFKRLLNLFGCDLF